MRRVRAGRVGVLAGYLVGLAACVGLLAAIPIGRPIWNSVWAEDGTIFYRDAVTRAWPGVIFREYGGYMHLVPRLIAGLAAVLPLGATPVVFTGASILVRALVAIFVFRASAGHLRAPAFRLLAAGAVILVPAGETYDNIANLHWYLIVAAFWAVLWRPASRTGAAVAAVVVIAAVDSDPLTLALTPLVLLRLLALRRWRDQVVSIAFAAAAALQLSVVAAASHASRTKYPWHEIPGIAAARVVLPFAMGRHFAAEVAANASQTGLLLGAAAILLVVCWPALRAGGPQRLVALGVLCVDSAILAGAWRNSAGTIAHPMMTLDGNSRYAVTATILLASALAASLSTFRGRERPWHAAFAAALAAVMVSAMVFGQSVASPRHGPTWSAQIHAARERCLASGGVDGYVKIQPRWQATVPCSVLDHRHSPQVGPVWPGIGRVR